MKQTLIVLMGATIPAGAAQAEEIATAHGANPGNPRHEAAELMAALSGARADGATTAVTAPSVAVGDDVEMLTAAAAGAVQITANSQGAMSQIAPEVGPPGLPFLFSDLPTARKVLDGEVGTLIETRAQEAGLEALGFRDGGIRNVTHTSKHVASPAGQNGMKIRTPRTG